MRTFLFIILLLTSLTVAPAQTKKTASKPKTTAKKTAAPAKKTTATKSAAKKGATKKTNKTAPPKGSISSLKNEQAKIKQNIKKQELALRANKAQVQQKLRDLERISVDMSQKQKSIDSINSDIHRLNSDISMLSSQLDNLQGQLNDRKAAYVKSMRYMAKQRGIQNQLMFIFSAKDFSQIYRRLRFVRQYAAFQRTQGKAVQEKQEQVMNKRTQLDAVKGEKNIMLSKGNKAKAALEEKKNEQQKIVSTLKNQQKTIQAVIDDQKKRDAALNAQIDKLVAEEVERARQRAIAEAKRKAEQEAAAKRRAEELARKKAEAEARARENARRIAEAKEAEERAKAEARKKANDARQRERAEQLAREAEAARIAAERKAEADKARADKAVAEAEKARHEAVTLSSADRIISGGFEANKGRMPSPLAGGHIVSHFGQHGVEGAPGVILDNKGINIKGSAGAAVRAIYDGEVSAVFNVQGSMGVLVRHGAYISVYCNLRSVSVTRGQKVSTRQTIGTVGRDNILQFQLRKERAKLNPEPWLSR